MRKETEMSVFFLIGLNFVTLKSLHKTLGLHREIYKCFAMQHPAIFPGLDATKVAKLVNDYFQKFAFQKK
jgi:hypothetical protein